MYIIIIVVNITLYCLCFVSSFISVVTEPLDPWSCPIPFGSFHLLHPICRPCSCFGCRISIMPWMHCFCLFFVPGSMSGLLLVAAWTPNGIVVFDTLPALCRHNISPSCLVCRPLHWWIVYVTWTAASRLVDAKLYETCRLFRSSRMRSWPPFVRCRPVTSDAGRQGGHLNRLSQLQLLLLLNAGTYFSTFSSPFPPFETDRSKYVPFVSMFYL